MNTSTNQHNQPLLHQPYKTLPANTSFFEPGNTPTTKPLTWIGPEAEKGFNQGTFHSNMITNVSPPSRSESSTDRKIRACKRVATQPPNDKQPSSLSWTQQKNLSTSYMSYPGSSPLHEPTPEPIPKHFYEARNSVGLYVEISHAQSRLTTSNSSKLTQNSIKLKPRQSKGLWIMPSSLITINDHKVHTPPTSQCRTVVTALPLSKKAPN